MLCSNIWNNNIFSSHNESNPWDKKEMSPYSYPLIRKKIKTPRDVLWTNGKIVRFFSPDEAAEKFNLCHKGRAEYVSLKSKLESVVNTCGENIADFDFKKPPMSILESIAKLQAKGLPTILRKSSMFIAGCHGGCPSF